MFLVFAPLILQELVVGDVSRLARFYRTWRGSKRWCSCRGQRPQRTFPETAVAQNSLDDFLLHDSVIDSVVNSE